MLDRAYIQKMARYNRWQNENLYSAAQTLSDDERKLDRGAFFGSIHKTLNHLLWADQIWLSRFNDRPAPVGGIAASVNYFDAWDALRTARVAMDEEILFWADGLDPNWISGDLTWYSGAQKRELSKSKWVLLAHFFNHQTHHRGQVHCMLTQAGGRPHDTDLPFLAE
jgi:uncharacterized damage-inducible protein DinB